MGRKSKELTNDVRKLKLECKKTSEIENLLGISESAIRSIWTKYLNTGEINKAKRSGRHSKMSQRDRNWLVRQTKMNRGHVLNDITDDFNRSRNENDHVHPRTVQRFLHKQDVKRRVVRKMMVVSQINRKKRVSWCLEKRKLAVNNYWNTVIFSDESQIVLGENYRVYVWRTSK